MRISVGKAVKVHKGDIVRIDCRFPRSGDTARLEVFSGAMGYELSPHVEDSYMGLLESGRPMMVPSMRVVLTQSKPKHIFTLRPTETFRIQMMQEKDDKSILSAKIRIKRYGTTSQAVRRGIRDFFRRFGYLSNSQEWLG